MNEEVFELASATPDVNVVGNIGVRTVSIEPGQIHPGHEHNYPHATHVDVAGKEGIEVTFHYADGVRVSQYTQGDWFQVPENVGHELRNRSLSVRAICLCVFGARDKNGELVEIVTDEIRRDRFWHEMLGGGDGG